MSEFINNGEFRKNTLKNIIKKLHNGAKVEDVKKEFEDVFANVSVSEITNVENELVKEGIKIEEIQSLCDVHASVFKGSIEEIHNEGNAPQEIPGHPLNTMFRENRKIESVIDKINENISKIDNEENYKNLLSAIDDLKIVNIHYAKKENLMFPMMEKYGITAPPQVMWGVDDEIKDKIKSIKKMLEEKNSDKNEIISEIGLMISKINEMIFKEENIMTPMLIERLNEEDWKLIIDGGGDFDTIVEDNGKYSAKIDTIKKEEKRGEVIDGVVTLPSGNFTVQELTCMLNTLPFDITFVDKNDKVKYFSEGKERTFARTRAVIGRNVSNCHPPQSVHIVEQIVKDFKAGKKDNEDFWIKLGDQFVLIRYFAVRNSEKEYLGVLEVTQNIKPIQEIKGEKRLMS